MEPILDHTLNRLHQGSSRITISDIPISYQQGDAPARETINAMITSFVCPGLELRYAVEASYKAMVHIPMTEHNEYNQKILSVNMICDDRQENYWSIRRYMDTLQKGFAAYPDLNLNSAVYDHNGNYKQRTTFIPIIDITMADGSMQTHQIIRFKRCFPLNLSDLQLDFKEPVPVNFMVSFIYSDVETIRFPAPSSEIIPPKHVAE